MGTTILNSDRATREHFTWQAYMSSALTMSNVKEREEITRLNARIRDRLQSDCDCFVYLPQEHSSPAHSDGLSPEEVYLLDRWRIAEVDFILLNLDKPAFGVGQEAEMAYSLGVPAIAFHSQKPSPSRLIRGLPTLSKGINSGVPSGEIIVFDGLDYDGLLEQIVAGVERVKRLKKHPIREQLTEIESFAQCLANRMKGDGVDVEELSARSGFTIPFLKHLLMDFHSVQCVLEEKQLVAKCSMRNVHIDRFASPGICVIQHLADVLECRVEDLIGEGQLDQSGEDVARNAGERSNATLLEFLEVAPEFGFEFKINRAAFRGDFETIERHLVDEIERRRRRGH